MTVTRQKQHGIHYTPPELAVFLAQAMLRTAKLPHGPIRVLDPACGDGELLRAFAANVHSTVAGRLQLVGYDTDEAEINKAQACLRANGHLGVDLMCADFLSVVSVADGLDPVDIVISNPPYVRTQVLGAYRSQQLAKQFGLTGRVDLYHAFVTAMASVLKVGGTIGLLTSNRFLTTKSGASLRALLQTEFELSAIYDLGDTKLFGAAVLPVIVIAHKRAEATEPSPRCTFDRVYCCRENGGGKLPDYSQYTILQSLRTPGISGAIQTSTGCHRIERGILRTTSPTDVWTLSTPASAAWLKKVKHAQATTFGELAHIRVGVKTTADRVFIRDWSDLSPRMRPEESLLRPLITHHDAARWQLKDASSRQRILYPHHIIDRACQPVDLADYPRAQRYLNQHRQRLSRRKYLIDAGRRWYELWVPHKPDGWRQPKIVYPDISEIPRFSLDRSGAIVNGDCYWITLRDGVEEDWLLVMLAVANSTVITRFYDTLFHNKLYAGRRRFMTQYVKAFPVPPLQAPATKRLIRAVKRGLQAGNAHQAEDELDQMVSASFGLA